RCCSVGPFSKNRDRLLEGDIATRFLAAVLDLFYPGPDRAAGRFIAGTVVAKNLAEIFWGYPAVVHPCDGVHSDRHASDDRLSTNSESAARACSKAGQRVAKHPAPDNAAAHDPGNLIRRC